MARLPPHGRRTPPGAAGAPSLPIDPGGVSLMELIDQWKIQDSLDVYEVQHWGKGYFGINDLGHVVVHPSKQPKQAIDLKLLVDQLQDRGIQLPILLRFTDILRHRVGEIAEAFQTAINEFSYQ